MKNFFRQLFLLKKHVSHNFTLIKPEKTQKKFNPIFQNFLQVLSPLKGKNFNFWKNFSRKLFLLKKHVSHNFTLIKPEKTQKKFNPIFQNFLQVLSPLKGKNFNFWKIFSDNFFYSKNMFHTISHWLNPKKRRKFFNPIFQNFLQVLSLLKGKNFNFWKNFFRQLFLLKKHVSHNFTLIKPEKTQKIFQPHFSKFFTSSEPPKG